MRTFLISIQKENKFFVARCPELGVTSQGDTLEEAQANIKEAIELYFESFGSEDLPHETSRPFWTTVEVRQRGSHVSLQKIASDKTYKTVVPMH
jgi:predicted RNase H-like HicB family nuclease